MHKVDTLQGQIVSALKSVGAQVQSLASVGSGCPDLLVAFRGTWYLLEVKDPRRGKITEAQISWHAKFSSHAPISVVTSIEEALSAIGAIGGNDDQNEQA